jgi:predicted TIM-barrel fold metal-dependent hydrolase
MGAIDVWGQIITPRMAEAPWLETLIRWAKLDEQQLTPTVETTIAAMDAAHIDITLLSAWYGPQGCLISNEEVNAHIDQAPDRFRGLASADISRPMQAVKDIRTWVDGKKFVGVRIVPWLWGLPPNDRRYYPLYAACCDLGVPLCTQIGHTGPLLGSDTGRLIPYLEDVMLEFPDLVIVGGHVGFPWIDELISMTIKFPNFHVDTSAYVLERLPPSFVHYMKTMGAKRVMFGTNWPMLTPAQCLNGLNKLGLTDVQQSAFLSETARRVFKLD